MPAKTAPEKSTLVRLVPVNLTFENLTFLKLEPVKFFDLKFMFAIVAFLIEQLVQVVDELARLLAVTVQDRSAASAGELTINDAQEIETANRTIAKRFTPTTNRLINNSPKFTSSKCSMNHYFIEFRTRVNTQPAKKFR